MVSIAPPPEKTDVFVIGGGPAGLAAALACRQRGFEVVVADRGEYPIDKACGEGVMPDGLSALRQLGVDLNPDDGAPFRGIRFLGGSMKAEATFSGYFGLGIRRPALHRVMVERAATAGVQTYWRTQVEKLHSSGVQLDGRLIKCRWIIGADGFHSQVRRWCGLKPIWTSARRVGVRQHFRLRPWTDFVEVYWHKHCQAYVTPVGMDNVCVALVGRKKEVRLSDLPSIFPRLAKRLDGAHSKGSQRGAVSMCVKLPAVTCGQVALLGDASGSVDAVTGEGLALAFNQALLLAANLASGNLDKYETFHRRVSRMPRFMARLLLLMDGSDSVRKLVLGTLASYPRLFNRLLAAHIGTQHIRGESRQFAGDFTNAAPPEPAAAAYPALDRWEA